MTEPVRAAMLHVGGKTELEMQLVDLQSRRYCNRESLTSHDLKLCGGEKLRRGRAGAEGSPVDGWSWKWWWVLDEDWREGAKLRFLPHNRLAASGLDRCCSKNNRPVSGLFIPPPRLLSLSIHQLLLLTATNLVASTIPFVLPPRGLEPFPLPPFSIPVPYRSTILQNPFS